MKIFLLTLAWMVPCPLIQGAVFGWFTWRVFGTKVGDWVKGVRYVYEF